MNILRPSLLASLSFLAATVAHALIGPSFQLQLGNPSNATADPANRSRYLMQRAQYAIDYNDTTREPNWVSWSLTSGDIGSSGRSDFVVDPDLPAGFRRVLTTDYSGSGFDRGHMCPSADRTVTAADNQVTFYMSNMVPQTPDNNQGVWASFETYCRTLANAGNEVLIVTGPSGFAGASIASGVAIPGFTWKIAVVVPLGPGAATTRITSATRVIALKVPNVQGVRSNPWQNYVTSAAQIETDTGYTFFTTLPLATAAALRARVDGESATGSPGIVAQPLAHTAPEGTSITLTVSASGEPPLSYQWLKDDTEIAGARSATLSLPNVRRSDAALYSVVVTNATGSIASRAAPVTVVSPGTPAIISWNFDAPTPATVVSNVATSPVTQHNNNGSTSLLTSTSVSSGYAGASGGNNAGAAARTGPLNLGANGSAYFEVTLTPGAGEQLIVSGLSFASRSTGTGPQAFDMFTNVDSYTTRVAGGTLANNSTWSVQTPAFSTITGARDAPVTFRIYGYAGSGGAATSTANWRIDDLNITVSAVAADAARLVNLSTRARAGVGGETAIAGFVVSGEGRKQLLVRVAGPALAAFGVSGALTATRLEVMRGDAVIGTNAGWSSGPDPAAVSAAATGAGAFPFADGSGDSALLLSLPAGNYTAIASAAAGPAGVALLEIYDFSRPSAAAAQLINLSTRAQAGSGDNSLIAGFVVDGSTPKRVLVRAAGPALAQFGVAGALARPHLVLRTSTGQIVAQNAGWTSLADPAGATEAARRAGAFPFSAESSDAALVLQLAPGGYTAEVAGADGAVGTALVEVYEIP